MYAFLVSPHGVNASLPLTLFLPAYVCYYAVKKSQLLLLIITDQISVTYNDSLLKYIN